MRAWWMTLLVLSAGCLSGDPTPTDASEEVATPEPGDSDGFDLVRLAGGFAQPLLVTHAGDERIFVVEQCGTIQVIEGDWDAPTLWLDVSDKVQCGGEQGLLGLAFPPDHAETGRFYITYSARTTGDGVLERWTVDGGAPSATPEELLRVTQPASNHNGGHLAFGPDGMLYYGLGDGGAADDAFQNGQNKATLLGAILRLDVSVADGYAIPSDNPFVDDQAGADEIWAWGLRNPWRFSFDADTGDLWIGDVGQNAWEEIDHQPASSSGGENYGWPAYEGTHFYGRGIALDHVLPVAEYANGENGDCSVTGGYVYRGSDVPALTGHYVLADYCSGQIRSVMPDGDGWQMLDVLPTGIRIASFGEDVDGEVYVVDHQGAVHRFVAA